MKENKVFSCPVCQEQFNTSSRLPLNLDCGDVICKICLISAQSQCPIDNTVIKKDINTLPICKVILQYLPELKPEQLSKYKASGKSSPGKLKIIQELELIQSNAKDKFKEIHEKLKYLSALKIALIDSTKLQLTSFETEINNVINYIVSYKTHIDNSIKELFAVESSKIENLKASYSQQNDMLIRITQDIKELYSKIYSRKYEKTTEEIINEKNIIIENWESVLKIQGRLGINKSLEILKVIRISPNMYLDIEELGNKNIIINNMAYDDFKNKSAQSNENGKGNEKNNNHNSQYQSESTKEMTGQNSDNKANSGNGNRAKTNPNGSSSNNININNNTSKHNKLFIVDCKGDHKPILVSNNYFNIVNGLKGKSNNTGNIKPQLYENDILIGIRSNSNNIKQEKIFRLSNRGNSSEVETRKRCLTYNKEDY